MAHLGCPIVGDGVYGGDAARGVDRNMHLHARELVLPYYRKKPPIVASAPVPTHMLRLLTRLGAVDADGRLLHLVAPAADEAAPERPLP
jgi:tRNA pseudouridine32 synthase/23S rRNA pseudouridine746 synthase/23S rRNA pseudouridine1911/1915/1917 synthase